MEPEGAVVGGWCGDKRLKGLKGMGGEYRSVCIGVGRRQLDGRFRLSSGVLVKETPTVVTDCRGQSVRPEQLGAR